MANVVVDQNTNEVYVYEIPIQTTEVQSGPGITPNFYLINIESRIAFSMNPDVMMTGNITRSTAGAATAAAVLWPDGTPGQYLGTESVSFPGKIDSYTITYGDPSVMYMYSQPPVTRDTSGNVIIRPSIVVT